MEIIKSKRFLFFLYIMDFSKRRRRRRTIDRMIREDKIGECRDERSIPVGKKKKKWYTYAMCKGLDYRCTDWLPSNFRLCCDCEACWPSFRNNHRLSQPRADSRCCSACTHRRYHRRSLRRYHHRRLRLHHRLLSSRNYRLEIETCPSDELVSISSFCSLRFAYCTGTRRRSTCTLITFDFNRVRF